uniref:Integrase, catalytic region, zinc finger, CCHC-type, peptidase aspartic, catalytic n=1 Tax=Tanacetum cinerariifolium TaxID=118510 RepID=A0A6L2LRT2_TANCI|nr:integrase, catalytic region, zinc finger, CCHC-type, peptidase aspartic, catalytic [Tanacetum cinerariifolium]
MSEGHLSYVCNVSTYRDEIILFVKTLKDIFNTFDQFLIDELSEIQNVFHQIEQAVEQHRLEPKAFEIKMNQVLNENERHLEQVINKDIVNIAVNSTVDNASVNVHECEKFLKLETELFNKKDFIEKETYDKLFRSYTTLEKYCISLEVDTQLNQEIFQRDNSVSNQRVKPSTSASGSQPSGNNKKDKIHRPPSSTQKNKIESHPRTVKSSLKNKSCDVEPKGTASVQHSKLNANSKFICVKCNGCMHSDNHYLCVLNAVNARVKSKSVMKNIKIKVWKPTGKTFTNIGYTWRPTGLGYKLFSVGQFCDSNLEVAFRQHTCFIRNLKGVDLLNGSRGNNLYTLSLGEMMASSPICLLSKASKTKSWLWHRRLSHLNFGAINHLSRHGIVRGLPKLKFEKDHLCVLLMQWEKVGISDETYVARSPRQNSVVERRNRTLIEASRTMLIYAKALLFLWEEAVATACYTQNRSMIRLCHGKTPYELLHNKPPDLSFLHMFGALCCPTNDNENLGKLQPKADIGIFIGYAPTKKAFRIYNQRTRRIIETIHVDFDELTAMASEHSSSELALYEMTHASISSGLMLNPPPLTSFVPPSRTD